MVLITGAEKFEQAQSLFRKMDFLAAIPLLQELTVENSQLAHPWYMLGQCNRFLGDIEKAVHFLEVATSLEKSIPGYFLALGIAYQLSGKFEQSLDSLRQATNLDKNYVEPFMSAAMTFSKMGNFEKAREVYDGALKALTRQFFLQTPNRIDAPVFGLREVNGRLWAEYAFQAMLYQVALSGLDALAWPSEEFAIKEYEDRSHGGLMWKDTVGQNGKTTRLALPNYFDTMREFLINDKRYSLILGDIYLTEMRLGKSDDCLKYEEEAIEFEFLREKFYS
jgi:tetratricopeptide (TPR) repeat protein